MKSMAELSKQVCIKELNGHSLWLSTLGQIKDASLEYFLPTQFSQKELALVLYKKYFPFLKYNKYTYSECLTIIYITKKTDVSFF